MMKIAIFASGTGTNAQAIIDQAQSGDIDVEVALVVSDKPNSKALIRASSSSIATFGFNPSNYTYKEEFESDIVVELQARKIDLVVLAGYMRLIGPTLLSAYEGKIVNIHPSLLPNFPGLDAIGQALRAGVSETGVTIHEVDAGMDTGPIIAQEAITIEQDDTIETLTKKIQAVEHRLYPQTIAAWGNTIKLEGVKSK
ncbi:phosphoribosylglycinamide formyltransferase [Alkalihalophilus lindianensis]|uniref:Phosphoribosylglycinamide formyltransferase n=1 Tax=Alkalihalophilus lindianensis TaxID=1630542 RepID=A0ABU3XE17_9BACI|nr:phosphoribosylglycinamide formyltransferase [Alkalihalophilus lindianensis]MDV2685679.1 phosphoribosylglycinamide formyltransferase [Alkalihalophilus lindianensis]